jgi:hypothetical protein
MPASRRPARLPRTSPDWRALAALAGVAAALAAGEVLLALHVGGFRQENRAEGLLFLAFRPWLLILAALIAARWGWPRRIGLYAVLLAVAGLNESIYLLRLGAADPWPEMVRGWFAGAALLVPLDLLLQGAGRWGARGRGVAAAAAAALLFVPGVLRPYHNLAFPAEARRPAAARPDLILMTALPIVWGERGAFDPESRPAGVYRALQEEFRVRPVDALDAASLGGARLLLLAQPRWLAPAELASLDRWVRAGGRALILTDPELLWPSDLPLGDVRRPPPAGLLAPLLDHWGLTLSQSRIFFMRTQFDRGRLIYVGRPGRLRATSRHCTADGFRADCRIGQGRAVILADSDMMHDTLWMGAGANGGGRYWRISDNPLILADLLDSLAGIERERVRAPVSWVARGVDRGRAELLALLPLLAVAMAALLLRISKRR